MSPSAVRPSPPGHRKAQVAPQKGQTEDVPDGAPVNETFLKSQALTAAATEQETAAEGFLRFARCCSGGAQMKDEKGARGILTVHVSHACGVRAADKNGLSDPYVAVKVAGKRPRRTRTITETLNPVWEQDLKFEGSIQSLISKPVELHVWDRDLLSMDDYLGTVLVSIDDLKRSDVQRPTMDFPDVPLTTSGTPRVLSRKAQETADTLSRGLSSAASSIGRALPSFSNSPAFGRNVLLSFKASPSTSRGGSRASSRGESPRPLAPLKEGSGPKGIFDDAPAAAEAVNGGSDAGSKGASTSSSPGSVRSDGDDARSRTKSRGRLISGAAKMSSRMLHEVSDKGRSLKNLGSSYKDKSDDRITGSISFSISYELAPMRFAFPAAPVHASIAQALADPPPPTATPAERARDRLLHVLATNRSFAYTAVFWAGNVLAWGIFVGVLYLSYAPCFLVAKDAGEVCTDEQIVVSIGMDVATLEHWVNVCLQVLTALFSIQKLLCLPWRLSIAVHQWAGGGSRAAGVHYPALPGCDFYGRPTDALWFHIPLRKRGWIVAMLLSDFVFHYLSQFFRMNWSTFVASDGFFTPGATLINATFLLALVTGITGGVIQGREQKKLYKSHPGRFPPDPITAMITRMRRDARVKARRRKSLTIVASGSASEGGKLLEPSAVVDVEAGASCGEKGRVAGAVTTGALAGGAYEMGGSELTRSKAAGGACGRISPPGSRPTTAGQSAASVSPAPIRQEGVAAAPPRPPAPGTMRPPAPGKRAPPPGAIQRDTS